MKRTHKWPAKALNLLVAVAMVISLVAVLAPAVVAQAAPPNCQEGYNAECDPVQQFDGCNLEVFLATYTKDQNGDFTPVTAVELDECFYVNAVVVNTGNVSTDDPIEAKIDLLDIAASLDICDGNAEVQTGTGACGVGEMQDFWWKVCCTAASGAGMIHVEVYDGGEPRIGCWAVATINLTQTVPEVDKCVEVKIIEAPGLTPENGDPGWYDEAYPLSPFEQTVVPCTNFGIKAKITNNCDDTLTQVNGTIRWGQGYNAATDMFSNEDTSPTEWYASIVGGDRADGWCLDNLDPGETAIVAWTLHCDNPGDVEVLVQVEESACLGGGDTLHPRTVYINNPWTVHQQGEGTLEVEILTPNECEEVLTDDPACPSTVSIAVKTTNNGDVTVENIVTTIGGNETAAVWEFDGATYDIVGTLDAGESDISYFTGICKGPGPVELTADANGNEVGGGSVTAADDVHNIIQTEVQATLPQSVTGVDYTYTRPTYVNKCETFEIVGSFRNHTGTDLTEVQVCIYWKGNASIILTDTETDPGLTMNPVYDRCLGSGWHYFDGTQNAGVLNTDVGNNSEYCYNCQTIPICNCCETLVKWTFQCNETEVDPEFYVYMSWTDDTDPVYEDSSLTGTAYPDCEVTPYKVYQEYKAHLIAGQFTFLQTDCGAMLNRTAFAPCQNFHVVMPVVNVGQANAENVVVNFFIDGVDYYDFISVTGDLANPTSWDFDEGTGLGWAALGTIDGNSMKKAIVQLHCSGEGTVNILVTGVTGMDENTDAAIHGSNVEIPPCPLAVLQVPFTVQILNPETCNTFSDGDRWAVKALITNDSDTDLYDLSATLHWYGAADVAPPQDGTGCGPSVTVCTSTKSIGNDSDNDNLLAGDIAEITWQMECTGAGEVYLWVTSTSLKDESPYLTATSEIVNVHQLERPNITVEWLSPDVDHDSDDPVIFSAQEFAVTAVVRSNGSRTAEGVTATLYTQDRVTESASGTTTVFYLEEGCVTPGTETIFVDGVPQVRGVDYTIDYIGVMPPDERGKAKITFALPPAAGSEITAKFLAMVTILETSIDGVIVDPAEMQLYLDDMDPGEFKIVSWTLRADTNCDWGCDHESYDLGVGVMATNVDITDYEWEPNGCYENGVYGDHDYDCIDDLDFVPAAHLVTEIISVTPASPFGVCDEFEVVYSVTNTGQADAWETSATLSVFPEGSVRLAEGEEGYTQILGTLVGWGAQQTKFGTFTLHCKEACESTITITPAGRDECGWGYVWTVWGEINYGGDGSWWEDEWDECATPGARIPDPLLHSASITVKQLESGGLDLGITKTADKSLADPEDLVVWTITVTNYGPTDATGVEVTDTWSPTAELSYGSHAVTQGTFDSGTGVWTVGDLVVGASATLELTTVVGMAPVEAVTNTAAITDVYQPDGYPSNDEASATINMTGVELDADWNLISLPLIPDNGDDLDAFFTDISTNLDSVWYYDASIANPADRWLSWAPGVPSDLTEVSDGKGYWIDMLFPDTLDFTGVELVEQQVPPSYDVVVSADGNGWNLIGFKSAASMAAGDYLNAIAGDWTRMYGYADGEFFGVQSDDMMVPGFGYWLAITADGTIYP